MARTINDIQEELLQAKANEPALADLNSTSRTAVWRLWIYIVSVAIWSLEKLFDIHKKEVDNRLSELKPHTARWYRQKALAFQYGFDLKTDSDAFDNEGKTEEQIAASKIVKFSAVTETDDGRLIVKIASETDGKLAPISSEQQNAFNAYIHEIKDAGVRLSVINYLPDKLQLSIDIYYDPLVLDSNGVEILTGRKPVEEALQDFLKNLPFNGELVLMHLVDALQSANGVKIVDLYEARTAWIDQKTNSYGSYQDINVTKIPESGYFEIDEYDSTINFSIK